jgi:hypothetical protein
VAEEVVDWGTATLRGIPYASVTKRWTQSSVQHSLPTTFDATKFGPKCPQPAHSSLIRVALLSPPVESDEFKWLDLISLFHPKPYQERDKKKEFLYCQ